MLVSGRFLSIRWYAKIASDILSAERWSISAVTWAEIHLIKWVKPYGKWDDMAEMRMREGKCLSGIYVWYVARDGEVRARHIHRRPVVAHGVVKREAGHVSASLSIIKIKYNEVSSNIKTRRIMKSCESNAKK
jgi:hypothetical protein